MSRTAPSKKPPRKRTKAKRVRYRNKEFLTKLGARLRQVRTAKGYSIDRLSLETEHLSRATISRIECGQADPQISTLVRIAECLGVELTHLVNLKK